MESQVQTMSVPEAGRVLGVGRSVAFRLAHDGTLPAIKLGKKLRVPCVALEKMLESAGKKKED